ncbi:MAG: hypothetical protein WBO36_13410, partial [Saprospiraceae bacterium]
VPLGSLASEIYLQYMRSKPVAGNTSTVLLVVKLKNMSFCPLLSVSLFRVFVTSHVPSSLAYLNV